MLREQAKSLARDIERVLAAQNTKAEESAERLKKLLVMQDDPAVLVRNYGANVTVYHDASGACGWVGFPGGFSKILLTEANERGLRPCSSCGYLVGRAA